MPVKIFFSNQTCNNLADATRAFYTSKESVYIEPNEPHFPNWFIHNTNTDSTIKTEEDSEYESKPQRYKMLNTMSATDHR